MAQTRLPATFSADKDLLQKDVMDYSNFVTPEAVHNGAGSKSDEVEEAIYAEAKDLKRQESEDRSHLGAQFSIVVTTKKTNEQTNTPTNLQVHAPVHHPSLRRLRASASAAAASFARDGRNAALADVALEAGEAGVPGPVLVGLLRRHEGRGRPQVRGGRGRDVRQLHIHAPLFSSSSGGLMTRIRDGSEIVRRWRRGESGVNAALRLRVIAGVWCHSACRDSSSARLWCTECTCAMRGKKGLRPPSLCARPPSLCVRS